MNSKDKNDIYRYFLKDSVRMEVDFYNTDQSRGIAAPPFEKPHRPDAIKIDLSSPSTGWDSLPEMDIKTAIARRKSRRRYLESPLSLDELSFLLWATQGLRGRPHVGRACRTVPSAGCRHAFETYLALFHVQGLEQGIYRYLPLSHQLLLEYAPDNLQQKVIEAALGQIFVGKSAVTFIWTAIPYRMEWRYGAASYKVIAIDAGHVCQNLYLACETIGAGTCAVAAYDQKRVDQLLRVDGDGEFVIYMAPVGKKS